MADVTPVTPEVVDPSVDPAVDQVVDPAVDQVIDPVKKPEDFIILQNQYDQLKNSQAGETRKNAELLSTVEELKKQMDDIKVSKMSEKEKTEHELSTLKAQLLKKDQEIERVKFLDKVKEACISTLISNELSPDDYEFVYAEDIEAMGKKAELLKARDKKLIDGAIAKLRGSDDIGRPGESNVAIDGTRKFTNSSEAGVIYNDIKAKKGQTAADLWWSQQKI